ncbi:hypothetical protein [Effusibacillus lacus]|uniref:Prolipoprotein diacylglyceryl transferase n=1 Tax=Effusibacillus lacus TaxID=1348429 RepID=A0A292YT56_9BACL|nr:hypothetical protein [Effusibacillus lacus]TCS74997.1 prolipoprotein diacylglyceryl transferase [Effusibacillus lacus]GAX91665.1 hypothetical protein EFBL_3355 [Effusibacillus lacus]
MALLDTYVKLGLWSISSSWIGILTGFSLVLWLIKRELTRAGLDGAKVQDTIFDSVFYGILATLLAPLLFIPKEVLERPFQILLGGTIPYATWIGWGIGIGYFVIRFRKQPIPILTLLDVLIPALFAGWSVYSIFVADFGTRTELFWGARLLEGMYHPVNVYNAILFAVSSWLLAKKIPIQPSGVRGALGLIILGTGGLLISLVDYNPTIWLFLTPPQWGFVLCAVVGILLLAKTNARSWIHDKGNAVEE